MILYYNMDGQVVPQQRWFEMRENFEENFRVAQTEYDGVKVSTVLLGFDHNWLGEGPPIIFETMIFGGQYDRQTWRYSTREEAEDGHVEACQKAFAMVGEK